VAARRDGRTGRWPHINGSSGSGRIRGSLRGGSARRGADNLDREPAVPLPCTGMRFVQRLRLLRIPFEIRKESSGSLGIIRWSSFARYRDRGDCGCCRTEDHGIGSVEVFEDTFRALRNCRARGAGQTDLSLRIRSANRFRSRGDCRAFQEFFAMVLAYFDWIHLLTNADTVFGNREPSTHQPLSRFRPTARRSYLSPLKILLQA
jgi:hypothetical protein